MQSRHSWIPIGFLAVGLAFALAACGKRQPKVYFGNLAEGAEVESPFQAQMRAENLVVEPASMGVKAGHGHFHIIVDSPLPSASVPIAADAQHIHYGDGQTEATLDLPEGEHTLILQFADGDHRPYDPQVYQQIHIRVTKRMAPMGMDEGGMMMDSAHDMMDSGMMDKGMMGDTMHGSSMGGMR